MQVQPERSRTRDVIAAELGVDRQSLVQNTGLALSFASAVSCLALLMAESTRKDDCYKDNKRWDLAIAFTIFSILLFAVNYKRIALAKLGAYNCVGMLYQPKKVLASIGGIMDHKLRVYGVLLHLGGVVTAIWWLVDMGGVDCGANKTTMEAFTWVAFMAFIGNTIVEVLLAFVGEFKVMETPAANDTHREGQHVSAHLSCSLILCGICVVIFMRLHEELNNKPLDQGLLSLNLFLGLVSTTMIAGDYLIKADLKRRSLLQTHRAAYMMVFVLACTSIGTYADVADNHNISNKRKNLIKWQFGLSIAALTVGPIVAAFTEAIGIEEAAENNRIRHNTTELRPKDGMSYNRLSKRGGQETSLTFV